MYRYTIPVIFFLFSLTAAQAQYDFSNKKAEKLYLKMEEFYSSGNYETILENEDKYLETFETKKDTLSALVYSMLGEAYLFWEGDLNKSLEFYEKEYNLRKEIGPVEGNDLNDVIYNLGYLRDELGYYAETEDIYLELLVLNEEKHGKKSEAYYETAYSLLDHYIYIADANKGLKLAQSLKGLVKNNSFEEAMVLKARGDLYEIQGSFRKSEKDLLEAYEILDKSGLYASVETVGVLNSLAGLYLSIGKVPESEELYQEALDILDRLSGDQEEYRVAVKANLARVYMALGNFPQADAIFKETLEIDKEYYGEESFIYGLDAYNLALNHLYAGNFAESEKYHLIAADIFLANVGPQSLDFARVLNNLTLLYTKTRELEKAKNYGIKAIEAFKASVGDNHPQTSFANYNLGDAYFTDRNISEAEKYHTAALAIRKKSLGENHPVYAKSTNKMAILQWKKNNLDDALKLYQQTFDNYFRQINLVFPILSEEEKTKFYYNNLKPTFEQYNSFIVKSSLENKALVGEMYNYQLATKGLIFYATNKVRETILSSGDSALIEKYSTWISQKEQLAKFFSATDLPLDIRNKKIDSLTFLSDNLERELSKSSSTFAKTFNHRNLTWQDVQKELKPGEAAIEIIRFRDFTPDSAGVFTDEVYYGGLVVRHDTKDYPELVIMRNGVKMETRFLSNYRNAIKYKIDDNFSYKLFWRPLANKLSDISKVYLSPDGVFNQISINTLKNPETGNFIIDEMEVHLVTNTKDLLVTSTSGKSGPSYLFGYPNYNLGNMEKEEQKNKDDERSLPGSRSGDTRNIAFSRGGSIPRGLRGNLLRYMRSNQMLALLPGTRKEVNLIDSLYHTKSEKTIVYMSNEALEENLKNASNPKVLHIATHGFFLESELEDQNFEEDAYMENPLLRAGLILAGANSFISTGQISNAEEYQEDGILTAYEAMNMKLDQTDLVVLSACETGLGEIKNGEGVYGMQRAFKVAGADAIIMSMWTVDDAATQELMTLFYEEWLSGKPKYESFVNAQRRLKEEREAPYYWGAFVMISN